MSARPAARSGLPLGRIAGVEVVLDRSWFVIAALTVVIYGPVLWRVNPQLGWLNLVLALAFAVGLALSVLLHELTHALVGRAAGWPVGRIVLTLMGGHTSFGAVSRARPGSTALVSVAGPAANVVVAVLGTVALGAVGFSGGPVRSLLELTVVANWILGAFNLLPGLPLDGGRVVEAAVWRLSGSRPRGTVVAAWAGRVIAALVVLWAVLTQSWRHPGVLVVTLMIAAFIFMGATQALRQARLEARLTALTAAQVARPALELDPTTPLSTVDEVVRHAYRPAPGAPWPDVVTRDVAGYRLGVLSPVHAGSVPPPDRANVVLGQVSGWCGHDAWTLGERDGRDLVERMERAGYPWLWVTDSGGNVTGVVHHEDLARRVLRGPGGPRAA